MSEHEQSKRLPTRVWDLPTRLFHWGLLVGIATSYLSIEFQNMDVHVISGACVLGLLLFRLLWGIWGASTAQFHQFIPSPKRFYHYLRPERGTTSLRIGHSPLAALSVIAMLLAIATQSLTGLVADDDVFTTGPLISYVESEFSEWATGLHYTNSDILLGLVGLHLLAIVFYRVVKKQRLTKPMVTGRLVTDQQDIVVENPLEERSWFRFFLTAAISGAAVYAIFNLA